MSTSESTQSIKRLGLPLAVIGALNLFVGAMAYGPRLNAALHASAAADMQVVAMGAVTILSAVLCVVSGLLAKLWLTDERAGAFRVFAIVAAVLEVACLPVGFIASGAPFGLVAHILCIAILAASIHLTFK